MKVYQAAHRIVERVRDYTVKAVHKLYQRTPQPHPLDIESAAHSIFGSSSRISASSAVCICHHPHHSGLCAEPLSSSLCSFPVCNKLPETEQLKTKIYLLTILEVRSQKSVSLSRNQGSCRQGCAPAGGSRGESVPCLFQLLASGITWLGCITPVFKARIFKSLSGLSSHCRLLLVCVKSPSALLF